MGCDTPTPFSYFMEEKMSGTSRTFNKPLRKRLSLRGMKRRDLRILSRAARKAAP